MSISPDDKSLRSLENPISAVFDLADEVSAQAPTITKRAKYAIIFVIFWLVINFGFIAYFIVLGNIIITVFAGFIFIFGVIALHMLFQTRTFFEYFVKRHSAIKAVRDGNPFVKVPDGKDALERFLNYLRIHNPLFKRLEQLSPYYLQQNVNIKGASGFSHHFDAAVRIKPGILWRIFGLGGNKGYALYIRVYESKPTLTDIQAFERGVEDVTERCLAVPSRIVAVHESKRQFDGLDEELYTYILNHPFKIKVRGETFTVNVQVATEVEGIYDFVPMIPELPNMLP